MGRARRASADIHFTRRARRGSRFFSPRHTSCSLCHDPRRKPDNELLFVRPPLFEFVSLRALFLLIRLTIASSAGLLDCTALIYDIHTHTPCTDGTPSCRLRLRAATLTLTPTSRLASSSRSRPRYSTMAARPSSLLPPRRNPPLFSRLGATE